MTSVIVEVSQKDLDWIEKFCQVTGDTVDKVVQRCFQEGVGAERTWYGDDLEKLKSE